jgi:hypothetical protein
VALLTPSCLEGIGYIIVRPRDQYPLFLDVSEPPDVKGERTYWKQQRSFQSQDGTSERVTTFGVISPARTTDRTFGSQLTSKFREDVVEDKNMSAIVRRGDGEGEEEDIVLLSRSAAGLFDESKEIVNFGYITLKQPLWSTLEGEHQVVCTGLGM